MLEHWVAVGRPEVVAGRWEARIENQDLVGIRHHSTTNVALNIDLPQSLFSTGILSNLARRPLLTCSWSGCPDFTEAMMPYAGSPLR